MSDLSGWPRVLCEARRYLKDAQICARLELCLTDHADDVDNVLPFRVLTTIDSRNDDDDNDNDDDIDDDDDDNDDDGACVVSVAYTLLNRIVYDTDLGAEKRALAAVLQAVISVFFIGQTKHKSLWRVGNDIAKVGKYEMARMLLTNELPCLQDDALRLEAMHRLFTNVQQFYPFDRRICRAADYAISEVQAELGHAKRR